MSSAEDLKSYRVEWRVNCVTHWTYMRCYDTLEDANAGAGGIFVDHGGQVRVIEQRVVTAKGMGMNVTRPPRVLAKVNPIVTVARR